MGLPGACLLYEDPRVRTHGEWGGGRFIAAAGVGLPVTRMIDPIDPHWIR